jgi:hypothetical protein
MNDPSVTATLKAAEEKHGTIMLVLAFLRRYWGRVLGVICAAFVCGKFYSQFQELQTGMNRLTDAVRTQDEHIQRQEGHLQAIDSNIVSIRETQTTEESRWNAVTTEAAIVITPKPRHK